MTVHQIDDSRESKSFSFLFSFQMFAVILVVFAFSILM